MSYVRTPRQEFVDAEIDGWIRQQRGERSETTKEAEAPRSETHGRIPPYQRAVDGVFIGATERPA
jgi:hypothetical protein